MEKLLVFGHKNPDTDTIASAIAMAFLQTKLGKQAVPCRLGNINKETEYALNHFNIGAPEFISEVTENDNVILVDHNEPEQCANGIKDAHVCMVVDHHRIKGFETADPLFYYAEPVGCTCTILVKLFKQNNIGIPSDVAGLMLSAIISDTLLFKSPTCTKLDVSTAEELARISNTDINSYGLAMLKAGTDLTSFSDKELVNLDAKKFSFGDSIKAKISQVNTADISDVMTRKSGIEKVLLAEIDSLGLDLNLLLITDIINSNSQVIAVGARADLIEKSYNVELEDNTALLTGVVSRKKQVLPVLEANA